MRMRDEVDAEIEALSRARVELWESGPYVPRDDLVQVSLLTQRLDRLYDEKRALAAGDQDAAWERVRNDSKIRATSRVRETAA